VMTQAQEEYQALGELEIMSQANNYNHWIWRTILPYVGNSIIEIGAGIGTFTQYLKNKEKVFATDSAQNCIDVLRKRFHDQRNIAVEELDIISLPDLEFWNPREIDTVICLNVLEHIKEDMLALDNMITMSRPGANIILMVPAFKFAFGTIDKLDGHFRRYSRKELRNKMIQAGLIPLKITYFNSIGLAAWYYTNKIVKNSSTSESKVRIYDKYIVPWLSLVERIIKPPFGQSLIAIGKKR
jgi:2-polyprenyl-3-methyl-5-hydroxy-6-metoxy-1,4-benzoquinol methylase